LFLLPPSLLHCSYSSRTGKPCKRLKFEEIADGALEDTFDVIVCSYAMHLLDRSLLFALLWQLRTNSQLLIVIVTPHKRPVITQEMGWSLLEELRFPDCRQRYRLYTST
jgi:hypothetical protein